MDNFEQHEHEVKKLQAQVRSRQRLLSLGQATLHSNTTRSADYKKNSNKVSIEALDRVLHIDAARKVALCEPRVSMQKLAQECLKMGFVPSVVSEFKGITVGGAIIGCGGESSSLHYGLFHDTCPKLELILGDGELVTASQHENSDLFDALGGSYGSLGMLVRAEVSLRKASDWVNITPYRFSSGKAAIQKISELMQQERPPEYLEGIIFSDTDACVLVGELADLPSGELLRDGLFSQWYYRFAQEQMAPFSMSLYDYLFRYDRGAFWMGAYVAHFPILKKLFMEGIWKLQTPKLFTSDERSHFAKLSCPNVLMRALSYPFMTSQSLFSLLHSCEEWIHKRLLVQDFTLPASTCSLFLDDLRDICPVYPLWLCPLKAKKNSNIFAPHSLNGEDSINIGIYGVPKNSLPLPEILASLEQKLFERGGRKWLYANSCYTAEQFWNVYSEPLYRNLRKKYNAEDAWISIEEKVLV
ncbi:MAG: FAD-binding protein [Verrucomicrobia bacterium]|nr:FAD-binding protein [Verrucomicrobiota bacterium]